MTVMGAAEETLQRHPCSPLPPFLPWIAEAGNRAVESKRYAEIGMCGDRGHGSRRCAVSRGTALEGHRLSGQGSSSGCTGQQRAWLQGIQDSREV